LDGVVAAVPCAQTPVANVPATMAISNRFITDLFLRENFQNDARIERRAH
jgi:hypothetical protein